MPQPKPAFDLCPERQEIAGSLQAVTDQIIALLLAEVDAVVKSQMEALEQIDHDLRKALDFQQSLRERYITHTQSHGCPPNAS